MLKRRTKFIIFALGESNNGTAANEQYIDCCVGSLQILISFITAITEDWGLRVSGALAYIHGIEDLVDFR